MKKRDLNDILQTSGEDAIRARLEAAHSEKANGAAHLQQRIKETALGIALEMICASDLLRKPAPHRQWCVEPWIPHREVTLLSGDGGIGKSTIALQLTAASVASLLWFGLEVRAGAALYISCEDDIDEIHFRLEQIKKHQPEADFKRLHIISLAGRDAILASPNGGRMKATPLFQQIDAAIEQHAIRLLVLDAAADVFGGEEVSRPQTRGFIQLLRGLAIRHDCAVVLLAHPSVDGMKTGRGYSGNTAWNNSVRSRLYFTRATSSDDSEPDSDLRILELAKSNRGRIGLKILMRWNEGCFVLDGASINALDALGDALRAEAVFLELLDLLSRQERDVSDKSSRNYAPFIFSQHPSAQGISKRKFEQAMEHLFAADKIAIETSGPASRPRRRIVRAA